MKLETPYHWFVADKRQWFTNDRLHVAIAGLLEYDQAIEVEGQYSVWRVPGSNADTNYEIDLYTPQVRGAVLVGVISKGGSDE